jgi:hypothetical protein
MSILPDGGLLLDKVELGTIVMELIYYSDYDKLVLFIYDKIHRWFEKRYEALFISSGHPYIRCDPRTMIPVGVDFTNVKSAFEMLSIVERFCNVKREAQ